MILKLRTYEQENFPIKLIKNVLNVLKSYVKLRINMKFEEFFCFEKQFFTYM